jgi:hypothetical protein
VASHEDGGGREDHPEGGRGEDRCVLPAGRCVIRDSDIFSEIPIFSLDKICFVDYMINKSYIHGGIYGGKDS